MTRLAFCHWPNFRTFTFSIKSSRWARPQQCKVRQHWTPDNSPYKYYQSLLTHHSLLAPSLSVRAALAEVHCTVANSGPGLALHTSDGAKRRVELACPLRGISVSDHRLCLIIIFAMCPKITVRRDYSHMQTGRIHQDPRTSAYIHLLTSEKIFLILLFSVEECPQWS